MRQWQANILLFFIGVLSCGYSHAQLTADFSASPQQGCAPLVVSFSDLSTGGTITYREWIFGNGNTSVGNNANPTASYINGGTYDVTLIVANATDTATITKSDFIVVFPNPIPHFSYTPSIGCKPLTVSFTNQSTVPLIGVNNYTWDFGDGSPPDSSFSPTHTYQNAGTYTVTLSIVDGNGCTASKDSIDIITVEDKPIADFTTIGPSSSCTAPFTVNFSNTSVGNNLSYNWIFQSAGAATTTNPSISFSQTGQFNVTLIATNQAGCSDTAIKPNYITILPTQAAFSIPDTVCLGDSVFFQNQSVGATSYQWSFGNGQSATQKNPFTFYNASGARVVTLIAQNGTQCSDTLTDTVYVEQVTANFGVDTNFSCATPFTVQYIDSSSSNVTSWKWVWGDNIPFNNNTIVFGQFPQRTIFSDLKTNDKLVVTTNNGCQDSISIPNLVEVATPKASLITDRIQGCAPLTVHFQDTSSSVDPIDSLIWQIDTFGISFSSQDSFTFQNPGTYRICLKVFTIRGCIDSTCTTILVGEAPQIGYFTPHDSVCAGQLSYFFDQSTDSTKIDSWQWDFSDSNPPSNAEDPRYQFADTGWMNLTYIVGIAGCKDTLQVDSVVYVSGPLSQASRSINCSNPSTVSFSGSFTSGQRFLWDFGDSLGLDSTQLSPQYTYAQPGVYEVVFSVFNDSSGCTNREELKVTITDLKAHFTQSDTVGCAPLSLSFNANGSKGVHAFKYQWDFGNGNSNAFSIQPTQTFPTNGTYQNRLVVEDINGCTDTMIKVVTVLDPFAQFSLSATSGCHPFTPTFTNISLSDTTVKSYLWDMGTGDTVFAETPSYAFLLSDSLSKDSIEVLDTFLVRLLLEDTVGCTSSFSQQVVVSRTNSKLFVSDTGLCQGDTLTLFDSLQAPGYTFNWVIGNGDSISGNPVNYVVGSTGVFQSVLKKAGPTGCTTENALNQKLSVQEGVAPLFTATPRDSSCYPVQVTFTDTTQQTGVVRRYWQFFSGGNLITTTDSAVVNTYSRPGAFTVSLITETENGCTDTLTKPKYINIDGPAGRMEVFPDTACKGDTIVFKLRNGGNLGSYFLDYGDGKDTTLSESDSLVKYVYSQTGTISPIVILSDSQQTCPQTRIKKVYLQEVIAGFQFTSDSLWCNKAEVAINETSAGGDQTLYFVNGNPWDTTTSPLTLSFPNTYLLKQVVTDQATGCTDSLVKPIFVFPPPTVTGVSDTTLCEGSSIGITLSGAVSYQWSPANGLLPDTGASVVATPQQSRVYSIYAIDSNGCDTTLRWRVDIQPEWNFSAFGDTTIYQGETAFIGITSPANNLLVNWTPNTALSCLDCYDPSANPLATTTYEAVLRDPFGCFVADTTIVVEVIEAFSVALPSTFSPNGDGINDEIFVKGWGIKELITFEIYNRWGEMIFRSSDLNRGWDGTHQGEPQNMDSYVYLVKAIGYNNEEIVDKGTVTLIR